MTAGGAGASNQTAKPAAIKRLGGFELICKVGQGGMGSVFKARQVSLDRIVALKILPPSIAQNDPVFIERFIREARTSAKLNHPNVVQGIEVGQDESTKLYYFAMEFVDGPSVKMVLKQEKRIAEKRALEIVAGVTQALICAQKAGIVHRDIKPDNILLTTKGEVKLADLGLARGCLDANLDESSASRRLKATDGESTSAGTVIGTPAYMAPEQIRGEIDKFDVRTDLYALGATLFHMATGRAPYVGDKASAIMSQHLNSSVPNPREVNPELSAPTSSLIMRLMQKDPARRYQTANDLAAAVNMALRGERVPGDKTTAKRTPVKPLPPVEPAPPPKPSQAGVYALIGVLVVAVAGTAVYIKHGHAGTPAGPVAPVNPVARPMPPAPPPAPVVLQPEKTAPNPPPPLNPGPVQQPELKPIVKMPGLPQTGGEKSGVGAAQQTGDPLSKTVAFQKDAPPKDAPDTQKKTVSVSEEKDKPPAPKKAEPPLEEQVLQQIAQPLEKLDIPAARARLKAFESEKKLEAMQNTAAELALESAIETHSKQIADQIDSLVAAEKIDEAQKLLDAVKFSAGDETSTAEVTAKALMSGIREKLTANKTLIDLNAAMKTAADVDKILLDVSAALDAGRVDQATKWIDEALKNPKLASSADFFKDEKRMLLWYADLQRAIYRGAAELSDNRQFILNQLDGRAIRMGKGTDLRYLSVTDDSIYVEQRIERSSAKRPIKFEALTRDTRYDLSMLTNLNEKATAVLKLKWAYADLSSMTAITSKSAGILDRAEKLIGDAESGGAPAEDILAVQPWLTRAQMRVRLPQKTMKGNKNPLLAYLPYVHVVSAGASAGSRCRIAVNGRALLEGTGERRGLNVVAISGEKLLLRQTFDTSADSGASKRFADAIAALPKGALVLVAVSDDASKNFQDTAYAALRSLGARLALQGKPYHFSYYCIGMTGLDDGLAIEEMGSGLLEYPKGGARK